MAFMTVERIPPRHLGFIPGSNGLGRTLSPTLAFEDTLPGSNAMASALTAQLREQALSVEAARADTGLPPVEGGGDTDLGPETGSRAQQLLDWVKANPLLTGVGLLVVVGGAYLLLKK